ncbi:hypothetical protein HYH03_009675 [Edaphochlamys debaryana]|uniref:Uncharacterized protein n=1 Tax=Edaphochlamys debaryana TaxID=47281 RepID=A0A835XVK3_9CHLO|nr:hypothetical protein HYH03_009675 [Edaphochlamys debaryana]|eukprot:KAG2491942.1 hypothetical protein HYH03_009675 [Edaphochlamys debaryana]
MGCAPSVSHDRDALPIKPSTRTAFARTATGDRPTAGGAPGPGAGPGPVGEGETHDVVLAYPLSGTVYGLEVQARYEKLQSKTSVWTAGLDLSVPTTPLRGTHSVSHNTNAWGRTGTPGMEIRPVPEPADAAAGPGPPTPASAVLSHQVRCCKRGVVLLVTAGTTWDEQALACLRLVARYHRPLVLVHCVQSCPLPQLDEWPPDVRPVVAACGRPVKYVAQHAAECLADVQERLAAAFLAGSKAYPAALAAATAAAQQAPSPTLPHLAVRLSASGLAKQQMQQAAAAAAAQHAAAVGKAVQAASAAAIAALAEASRPGPLTLTHLQASDPAQHPVCRRAMELLGPARVCTPQSATAGRGGGSAGASSRPWSPFSLGSTTPVEALQATGSRPSTAAMGLRTPLSTPPRPGLPPSPLSPLSPFSSLPPPSPVSTCGGGGGGGGGDPAANGVRQLRCVLRYRHAGWAAPVAFVTAQLEEEYGRGEVGLQVGAHAHGGGQTPASPSSPADRRHEAHQLAMAVAAAAAGASRARSAMPAAPLLPPAPLVVPAGPGPLPSLAAAAPADAGRRPSSAGSGPASSGECVPRPDTASRNGSARTSVASGGASGGGAAEQGFSPREAASPPGSTPDDECMAFSDPADPAGPGLAGTNGGSGGAPLVVEDCASRGPSRGAPRRPPLADADLSPPRPDPGAAGGAGGGGVGGSLAARAPSPTLPVAPPPARHLSSQNSWTSPAPEPVAGGLQSAGPSIALPGTPTQRLPAIAEAGPVGRGGCMVYFLSPGLATSATCLAEMGRALAAGARVVAVVDAEAGQRLAEAPPNGVATETWQVLRKVWKERLLYCADYHASFCAMLKEAIAGTAGGSRRR